MTARLHSFAPVLIVALILTWSLSGCMYTVANTAAKTAAIQGNASKKRFQEAIVTGYQNYLDEAATSGCASREYTVRESVFQYIRNEGDTTMEDTIAKLKTTVRDSAASREDRSESAYYLALIYMRPATDNPYLASSYIDLLKNDLSGTRDCIAQWLEQRLAEDAAAG